MTVEEEWIAEVKRHWEHWSRHLGLDNWWLHVQMMTPKEAKEERRGSDPAFTIQHHPGEYMRAYIHIAPKQERTVFNFERRVVHEMFHTLLTPTFDEIDSLVSEKEHKGLQRREETLCDLLASIVWRLHEASGCGA